MKTLINSKSELKSFILSQGDSLKNNYDYIKKNRSYMPKDEYLRFNENYKNDKETIKKALLNLEKLNDDRVNNLIEIANVYTNRWAVVEKIAAA